MIAAIAPLAHAGDLLVDVPIFAGPVLILAGWLLWMRLRGDRG
jgi:hypothetical protein